MVGQTANGGWSITIINSTSLINNALQNAPDMQVAEQRIQLAEAQAKAVATQDGPQIDFSADMERQKMSAEG